MNTLYAMARELDVSLDELLFVDARGRSAPGSGPPARRDPRPGPGPGPARARPDLDPPRVGRRLGAPHHRVAAARRLPVRDLRGRRRVEPGARVPAPRRPRVGLHHQRHAPDHGRLRRVSCSDRATRSPSTRRSPIASPTTAPSRSTRSGSCSAGGARTPAPGDSSVDAAFSPTAHSGRAASASRRPRRLVVRRLAAWPRRRPRTASPARSSSVRRRAPSTPSSRSGPSRPAAGSSATSTRSRSRSTSSAGDLALEIDGHVHHLVAGDFALMNVGTPHALANAGPDRGPLALGQHADAAANGRGATRHVLRARAVRCARRSWCRAERPRFGHPSMRFVGHYEGTPPQAEVLRPASDPARGRGRSGWTRRCSRTAGSR